MKNKTTHSGERQESFSFVFPSKEPHAMTKEQAKAKALFQESILRAGDSDYARILPAMEDYKAIAELKVSKWAWLNGDKVYTRDAKATVYFMNSWQARRRDIMKELDGLYSIIDG